MAAMDDFFSLAKKLRHALADLYPHGYVKQTRNGNTETITIKNFGNKPISVIELAMIGEDGFETDLTPFVKSIVITKP